jgi:hypothetical protein
VWCCLLLYCFVAALLLPAAVCCCSNLCSSLLLGCSSCTQGCCCFYAACCLATASRFLAHGLHLHTSTHAAPESISGSQCCVPRDSCSSSPLCDTDASWRHTIPHVPRYRTHILAAPTVHCTAHALTVQLHASQTRAHNPRNRRVARRARDNRTRPCPVFHHSRTRWRSPLPSVRTLHTRQLDFR